MMRAIAIAATRPRSIPRLVRGRLSNARKRRDLARASSVVPAILAAIPPQADASPPAAWRVVRAEWTLTDVAVIAVGPAGRPPSAILKLPHTPEGIASVRRQRSIQAALRADPRLGDWHNFLPTPLAQGTVAGRVFTVEQALPGRTAEILLPDRAACVRMQSASAATIGQLHRRTAASVAVDTAMLTRWVDEPLLAIRRVNAALPPTSRNDSAIERLQAELYGALIGHRLSVSWIHGDYWPGNILVDGYGATPTGIVDWDRAAPGELPLHDFLHLLLFTRRLLHDHGPADILAALAGGVPWTPGERALLQAAGSMLPGDPIDERAMVLLYWLRATAGNLALLPRCASDRAYVRDFIVGVLGRL